jgi:hypothetical protein
MPWAPSDAPAHNGHTAGHPHLQKIWAAVATKNLKGGMPEGQAIREANAAVARQQGRRTGRDAK